MNPMVGFLRLFFCYSFFCHAHAFLCVHYFRGISPVRLSTSVDQFPRSVNYYPDSGPTSNQAQHPAAPLSVTARKTVMAARYAAARCSVRPISNIPFSGALPPNGSLEVSDVRMTHMFAGKVEVQNRPSRMTPPSKNPFSLLSPVSFSQMNFFPPSASRLTDTLEPPMFSKSFSLTFAPPPTLSSLKLS
jgi:hypothetical protein